MNLRCYLIESDPIAADLLCSYIEATDGFELIGYENNPTIALQKITNKEILADITFVNADLAEFQGLSLAQQLLKHTCVVVTSAHVTYAAQAFDLNIFDYMLKPISYERFLRGMIKIKNRIEPVSAKDNIDQFFIQCELKGNFIKIVSDEILYVESQLNYLKIHTQNQKYHTYLTMKEIEIRLSEKKFMRVHKSFLANLDKVVSVEGNMIHLPNGKHIVIGPNYRKEYFNKINQMLLVSKRRA